MVLFVALNIETLYPPKDNLQAIYQDAMHVGMFYIIAILVIFVISTLHTHSVWRVFDLVCFV
jgi:hypothetical protein